MIAPPGQPADRPTRALVPRALRPRGVSLTTRILAVNVIALALLAGSFFYLDSYRTQLLGERFKLARAEAEIAADALDGGNAAQQKALLVRIGREQRLRLRLFDRHGRLEADSFALAPPSFALVDPAGEAWYQHAARLLDRGVDFIVGAPPVERYAEPATSDAANWPEVVRAQAAGSTQVYLRYAPDRTPVLTAATPVGPPGGQMLLAMRNAVDITQAVRDARQTLVIIIGLALMLSVQLSLFLARTIVQPLRALVRAAVRVRLGRDREVVVPRLPERGDEIGMLARAFSDMTMALRHRIDAVESFAADVAHELKNPLASLASAIESLDRVEDPALRRQLTAIATHDVQRIDRLITEIADASRIDAELSRATFVRLDLGGLAAQVVGARGARDTRGGAVIRLDQPLDSPLAPMVVGDAMRLERVLENLLDNAVSFSPPGGRVDVTVWTEWGSEGEDSRVLLSVTDQGPGIPASERDKVFERFHSVRPAEEAFGAHSGLGLAIARTIAEAHDGRLTIIDRPDGAPGACLVLALPHAGHALA
ncbi:MULTISPECIES: ATP-binding protein [unclassified Novosphingobium]|uniref:sensor histidine kinase n=1 Tax=unclassified Novosphingobium TaxID=2644732 RepID=UPI0014458516|nr:MULTISPECIES: ATP-binding protein [unclassified Novosphingobium]NKJ43516.1 two-component system sensor histidine kinase ChvG [Novosphingobium sp. SG720]NMN06011.1 two-component system sensor histidine kinase ChvG [Novosphingobium sp. SG919]NMN88307.1 two-component system sensor histidine kinase ChvG [Novosphingobium sp. SG916]